MSRKAVWSSSLRVDNVIVVLTKASLKALLEGKDSQISALEAELHRYEARLAEMDAERRSLLELLLEKRVGVSSKEDSAIGEPEPSHEERQARVRREVEQAELDQCARQFLRDPMYAETIILHAQQGSIDDLQIVQRAMEFKSHFEQEGSSVS
jgi:hypothetical protein